MLGFINEIQIIDLAARHWYSHGLRMRLLFQFIYCRMIVYLRLYDHQGQYPQSEIQTKVLPQIQTSAAQPIETFSGACVVILTSARLSQYCI